MNSINVSIIIPVFNTEKYLKKCLDSILNQSLANIEVICVDDCSTDSSKFILDDYQKKDSRIIVLHNSINCGQAHARNRGLDIAKGEYIYFMDADDILKQGALDYLYSMMEDEDLDGVLFAAECIAEDGYEQYANIIGKTKTGGTLCSGRDMVTCLLNYDEYSSAVWIQFWRRTYLEMNALRFREDTSPHEDILFSIQAIFLSHKIRCIPNFFYIYRKRRGATTTTAMNKKKAMAILICYIEAMKFIEHEKNDLSYENIIAIGKYSAKYRRYTWDSFQKLASQGFDIDTIEFINDEHKFFFHSYILGRYAFISDFLPVKVRKKIQEAKYVIVYGAGHVGKEVIEQLMSYGFAKFLVAVSKKEDNNASIMGRTIFSIDELKRYKDEAIVLVSAIKRHQAGMIHCLKENGFSNYVCMVR